MKKRIKILFSLSLAFIFIFFIYKYIVGHKNEFLDLLKTPPPIYLIITIFILYSFSIIINAQLVKAALKAHNINLNTKQAWALGAASSAGNYFMPFKGGAGLRAIYLKNKYNLNISAFMAQFIVIGLLTVSVAALCGLIGLSILTCQGQKTNIYLFLYFLLASVSSVLLIPLIAKLPLKENWQIANNLLRGWREINSTKNLLKKLLVLDFFYILTMAGLNFSALLAFGVKLSLAETLFYTGGQIHVSIMNLTPGGLGVVEAYSVYIGQILNYSPAQALMAQGLLRLIYTGLNILLGLIAWFYLFKKN